MSSTAVNEAEVAERAQANRGILGFIAVADDILGGDGRA